MLSVENIYFHCNFVFSLWLNSYPFEIYGASLNEKNKFSNCM